MQAWHREWYLQNLFNILWRKTLLNFGTFQTVPGIIKSWTQAAPSPGSIEGIGLNPSQSGTQGSVQMFILSPLPTILQVPKARISFTFTILLQNNESPPLQVALRKSPTHRYFFLNISPQIAFDPGSNSHPYFANNALLKSAQRLKPRPLAVRGRQMLSQDRRGTFYWPLTPLPPTRIA